LKEQLLSLLELQQIDARIQEIRQAMAALPAKLAPAVEDLARLEALLQLERDKLAETERWRKEQEELIRAEEDAVKQAKTKLQASRTAKDFSAANRELDFKRRSISEREDEVLKVIEAIEASRQSLAAKEKDVGALREHVEAEQKKIDEKVAELEVEISKFSDERERTAAKVPVALLRRYEVVLKRRGIGLVPAIEGDCKGCHMSLPPQFYYQLARFESVEACPRCQRLLYRADLLEAELGGGKDDKAGGSEAEGSEADGSGS
jgi:uncharacterized protein